MVQFFIARYTTLLPLVLESGLEPALLERWLMGTLYLAIPVMGINVGLNFLKKKNKAGKVVSNWVTQLEKALWSGVVFDALAPIIIPMLVLYGIAQGLRSLWESRRRQQAAG